MIKLTQQDYEGMRTAEDARQLAERIEAESEAYTSRLDPLDRARVTIDGLRSALIQSLTVHATRQYPR